MATATHSTSIVPVVTIVEPWMEVALFFSVPVIVLARACSTSLLLSLLLSFHSRCHDRLTTSRPLTAVLTVMT